LRARAAVSWKRISEVPSKVFSKAGFGGIFTAAFKASIPVLLGYTTIGFAFGLVLTGAGLPWWLSPVMALTVYAGAAQFMGVGLMAAHAGITEAALLTLLMNARHAVYGLSLLEEFSKAGKAKPYLIFGLTDETYGLLTTVKPPDPADQKVFHTLITGLNQFYWFLGCTAGGLIGSSLPFDTKGLDFALTALFVVLLVEQMKTVKTPAPYLLAIVSAIFALIFVSGRNFLLVSLALAACLLLLFRKRIRG